MARNHRVNHNPERESPALPDVTVIMLKIMTLTALTTPLVVARFAGARVPQSRSVNMGFYACMVSLACFVEMQSLLRLNPDLTLNRSDLLICASMAPLWLALRHVCGHKRRAYYARRPAPGKSPFQTAPHTTVRDDIAPLLKSHA